MVGFHHPLLRASIGTPHPTPGQSLRQHETPSCGIKFASHSTLPQNPEGPNIPSSCFRTPRGPTFCAAALEPSGTPRFCPAATEPSGSQHLAQLHCPWAKGSLWDCAHWCWNIHRAEALDEIPAGAPRHKGWLPASAPRVAAKHAGAAR